MDLDAALGEAPRGVPAQAARDLGQDLRRGVDEHPPLRDLSQRRVEAQRGVRQVVQLAEALHPRVACADEDEAELRRIVRVDDGALELQEDVVAERDRIGEVLEAHPVLGEARDGQCAGPGPEGDHQPLVRDLDWPGERVHEDGPPLAVEPRHVAEQELCMRAHLAERDDDVARLERAGGRLGQERRVQHEVLERDDRRPAALQEPRDVASREAPSQDERASACCASVHGSCLPRRWRVRSR